MEFMKAMRTLQMYQWLRGQFQSLPPRRPVNHVIHILLISPGKCAEVRMQNLQQLRYLQELYNDNILTEAEYQEVYAL